MWLARNLPLFHEMFSFLKSFFRRPADAPVETADSSVVTYPDANPHHYPNAFSAPARPLAHNQVPTAAPVAPRQVGGYSPVKGIELSLQAVINNLPLELQPRILQREVGDATISVPLEVVLSQLSRGSVAVGFGQFADGTINRVIVALVVTFAGLIAYVGYYRTRGWVRIILFVVASIGLIFGISYAALSGV